MKRALKIELALSDDAKEILNLQKIAYQSEAELHDDFEIPPLHQPLEEVAMEIENGIALKILDQGCIIASVRANQKEGICFIGKLIVQPEFQNQGIGSALLNEIESWFPAVDEYVLFTGHLSSKNIGMYERRGYEISDKSERLVFMKKHNSNRVAESIDSPSPHTTGHSGP